MRRRKGQPELPYNLEMMAHFDEVVLKEHEQEADPELPAGFEDLLYEAWREKQNDKKLEEERSRARSLQLKQDSDDYFIRVVRDRQDP